MLPIKRMPTPPGEVLLEEFLIPLKLSQEQLVKHLGGAWTQSKLSKIINKKRQFTAATALDFADVFGTSAEFWLNLHYNYHLWVARQKHKPISLLPALQKIEAAIDKTDDPHAKKKR